MQSYTLVSLLYYENQQVKRMASQIAGANFDAVPDAVDSPLQLQLPAGSPQQSSAAQQTILSSPTSPSQSGWSSGRNNGGGSSGQQGSQRGGFDSLGSLEFASMDLY
jgi:hypothetical protein